MKWKLGQQGKDGAWVFVFFDHDFKKVVTAEVAKEVGDAGK